jgi:S1-C subfamily serine protease
MAWLMFASSAHPPCAQEAVKGASDWVLSWFKTPVEQHYQHQPAITADSLNPKAGQVSFAAAAKKVMPAVVDISAIQVRENRMINPFRDDPFFEFFFRSFGGVPNAPRKSVSQSSGSGVIVSPDGLVATCAHVVQGATHINVKLQDGQELEADVLDTDGAEDLAVLKIRIPSSEPLPYINIGNADALEVGDVLLAVGNAFGLGQTVTSGILSAPLRAVNNQVALQTDAPVNPGNSGGALVNLAGELVGIPNAILSRSGASHGVGFARPALLVQVMLNRLIHKTKEPWLGIYTQALTAELLKAMDIAPSQLKRGVIVTELHPQSPGREAGLKPKDIITTVNGMPVASDVEFDYRQQLLTVGQPLKIGVWRDGHYSEMAFKPQEAPEGSAPERYKVAGQTALSGIVAGNLSPALARKLHMDERVAGVVILEAPHKRGFNPGDIILQINDAPVETLTDLKTALATAQARGSMVILLQRGSQRIMVRMG